MIRRIPVVATIRDAYIFTATQLGGIIGLIWVSMVMITVARFFTFHRLYSDLTEYMASGNAAPMGPAFLMLLAYLVAALLLYAIMFVAVIQLAAGTRPAPVFVHFTFGPMEWRMFRAFFAFVGLMMMISFSLLLAANAFLAFLPGAKTSQEAMGGIMVLILLGVGISLAARFLLLLPAIAVHETGPVLRRAWALSAGHALPLIGILLGLFLPLLLVFITIDAALGDKAAIAPGASQQAQMAAAFTHLRDTLPLTCGLSFFFSPVVVGLFASASVSAWRALKDEPVLDIAV